jgi:hypothetical protein
MTLRHLCLSRLAGQFGRSEGNLGRGELAVMVIE